MFSFYRTFVLLKSFSPFQNLASVSHFQLRQEPTSVRVWLGGFRSGPALALRRTLTHLDETWPDRAFGLGWSGLSEPLAQGPLSLLP